MKYFLAIYIAISQFFSATLQANEVVKNEKLVEVNRWFIGVTLGYGKIQQPLTKQDDIELFVLPDIRFYGEKISLENLNLSYALVQQPNFVLELVGKQNFDGIYFPGDNRDALSAAASNGSFIREPITSKKDQNDLIENEALYPPHKSMSYLAGVELRKYGFFDVYFATLFDISNVHHGYELDLSLQFHHKISSIKTSWELGIMHKSDKLSNYYYGVDYAQYEQNNVTMGSTNSFYLQHTSAYNIAKNWLALGVIKQEWLDSDFNLNPIIERTNILSYFIGVKYIY